MNFPPKPKSFVHYFRDLSWPDKWQEVIVWITFEKSRCSKKPQTNIGQTTVTRNLYSSHRCPCPLSPTWCSALQAPLPFQPKAEAIRNEGFEMLPCERSTCHIRIHLIQFAGALMCYAANICLALDADALVKKNATATKFSPRSNHSDWV